MLVLYLLASRNNNSTTQAVDNGNISAAQPGQPTTAAGAQPGNPEPTVEDAPRMPLAEFKKLYDDPAKRPIIVDVRPKTAYDQGHIKGAISLPHTDLDARISELPKDKLIVAYCQ